MNEAQESLLNSVVRHYLESGDFNGYGVFRPDDDIEFVKALISGRKLDLVRGDGHPNPHIKAFDAEDLETQLAKINEKGLAGCLYPTPEHLEALDAGRDERAPYTKELKLGAPQLSHRSFDLRSLEWYRNDPRFEFRVDDIHGRIIQKAGTEIAGRKTVQDGLDFFEFGFAYDEEKNRAAAAFVRYLHDLPTEIQVQMKLHELEGKFLLHPDFYRTQIIGDFPERISVYDAFLEEKRHVNRMCEMIGKPRLFKTEFQNMNRPRGFGILLRPTLKEFRDFALLLDQLLSDDIDNKFFERDIDAHEKLTNAAGEEIKRPIGTIMLLENWIRLKFRPQDPEPMDKLFKDIRAVRQVRQKPAHKFEDDIFDQKFVAEQRALIIKAFDAVRTIRMILENHPQVNGYEIPDYLREAKIWTM